MWSKPYVYIKLISYEEPFQFLRKSPLPKNKITRCHFCKEIKVKKWLKQIWLQFLLKSFGNYFAKIKILAYKHLSQSDI